MSGRSLATPLGIAACSALALAGCGKGNLATTAATQAPSVRATVPFPAKPAAPAVPVPFAITAARAATFAHAVQLPVADVPGARATARSAPPLAREREAAHCGGRTAAVIGGGRSAELQRGRGLERETISSSAEVLHDAKSVERDLAYAVTPAGLHCYERVLGNSLRQESDPNVRLLGVRVAPLRISVAGAGQAQGLRILARVGVPGSAVVVQLFVDALSLPYGPAQLDLYGTSFVQPVPERTEQELLALMRERARHHPL